MRTDITARPIGFLAQDQLTPAEPSRVTIMETIDAKVQKAKDGYQVIAVDIQSKELAIIYYSMEPVENQQQLLKERVKLNFLDKMYGLTIEVKLRYKMIQLQQQLAKQKSAVDLVKQYIV